MAHRNMQMPIARGYIINVENADINSKNDMCYAIYLTLFYDSSIINIKNAYSISKINRKKVMICNDYC